MKPKKKLKPYVPQLVERIRGKGKQDREDTVIL